VITYRATLDVPGELVTFTAALLAAERRRGTDPGGLFQPVERWTRSDVSSSTRAGTGIGVHSSRGRSWTRTCRGTVRPPTGTSIYGWAADLGRRPALSKPRR
jgi:hypothetical protein